MDDEFPYGAWVTKNDIIIVGDEGHYYGAFKHLHSIMPSLVDRYTSKKYSIYKIMVRLGYIRLFYYRDGDYSVEYWNKAKLSSFQKQVVNNACEVETISIYRHE